MRNIEICKQCQYCHIDTINNGKYTWSSYQCVMRSGVNQQGFMIDAIAHVEGKFQELPLYGNCPYYMEHIIMIQEFA